MKRCSVTRQQSIRSNEQLSARPDRVAALGADVDPGACHLHRLQVADVAADAVGNVPVWKHLAYLLAWPGMDAASFLEDESISNRSHCPSAEWRAATATPHVRRRAALRSCSNDSSARRLRRWMDRNDWHRADPALRDVSPALVLRREAWCAGTSADEQAVGVNEPQRILGPALEHRVQGPDVPVSLSSLCVLVGPRWGIVAGFLFSGAIHDLVISVPARGGYGGPTVFFAIQGAAMVAERSAFGRRIGLGGGWSGRLFAAAALLAPAGLLFHRPFVVGIIVPFMRALGAL